MAIVESKIQIGACGKSVEIDVLPVVKAHFDELIRGGDSALDHNRRYATVLALMAAAYEQGPKDALQ